jgi:hypothetical protein
MPGPSAPAFLAALNDRWTGKQMKSVFPGGWYDDDPPEDQTQRPYVVVTVVSDSPFQWTNKGRYDRLRFDVAITADAWDTIPTDPAVGLDVLMPQLAAATEFAPLKINGFGLVLLRPGPTRYEENKNIHRAVTEYEVTLAGGYNRNP